MGFQMANNYSYEMPSNFLVRTIQYLRQKNTKLADSFNNCSFDYEDKGLAYYAGIKGDTWGKRAIILTIEGNKRDVELLKKSATIVSSAISNALQANTTGFLLKEILFLESDDSVSHTEINNEIEDKFIEISNRQAAFDKMSLDEKLEEINNLIENLLKKNDKYLKLPYGEIAFKYVSNDIITQYRKQTHCFRHSSEKAIKERKTYTEAQKLFLVDYGLIIVKIIHSLIGKENI